MSLYIIGYDSTVATDIPTNAEVVMGYADGLYQWHGQSWDRFPNAKKIRIATSSLTYDARVLDVEKFDATAQEALSWIAIRRWQILGKSSPHSLAIYTSFDNMHTIIREFQDADLDIPNFIIAWWNNNPKWIESQPPYVVGHQYANPPQSGGHYDKTIFQTSWVNLS
jgi:hypothetical protein